MQFANPEGYRIAISGAIEVGRHIDREYFPLEQDRHLMNAWRMGRYSTDPFTQKMMDNSHQLSAVHAPGLCLRSPRTIVNGCVRTLRTTPPVGGRPPPPPKPPANEDCGGLRPVFMILTLTSHPHRHPGGPWAAPPVRRYGMTRRSEQPPYCTNFSAISHRGLRPRTPR
ncbi:hypothetical protein J2129_000988 [Methanofollis sp. W23]|nr:hypothetical protein [Methanofollis sp. W23]